MANRPCTVLVLFLAMSFPLTGCAAESAPQGAALPKSILDLSLEPPVVNTNPGPEYADEARNGAMIIGMDRTPKGRIWGCWTGNGDNSNGYFILASSDDGGKAWSKPRLVIDPRDHSKDIWARTLVGNVWTDPNGKLWLFFDQSLGYFDGRCGDWYITCDNPDDDKPVWSKPVRFADGCTLNKPTVLKNGDWLLPVAVWTRDRISPAIFKDAHHETDAVRMANVYATSDQGKTWSRRGGVAFPNTDFDEHMIVERRDGSLWMLARTKDGVAESTSTDGGKSWTEPKLSNIAHISARFHIRRLASGKLLLVKHGSTVAERTKSRSHLTAFLSDDDGKTWTGGLLLDERAGVSYPDGFQSPDGLIHILYDWNRHSDAEILLATFREEDIAAGKFASPGARQKHLVNKATGKVATPPNVSVSTPEWRAQAEADAKQDRSVLAYDGVSPNKMVCDTMIHVLPDKSWAMFILAGGDTEPSPLNYIGLTRSRDEGKTWSPLEPVNVGLPREGATKGQGATDLIVSGNTCTLFFATHSRTWGADWKTWFIQSEDSCKTWSKPQPMPGRLADNTFIRPHIRTRDGRIILPFQHYVGPPKDFPADKIPPTKDGKPGKLPLVSDPRNGVLISKDDGKTWSEHGNIRLNDDPLYFGWAEPSIVELSDGRIAMTIRGDKLGGMLYYAESKDGGVTWPAMARKTDIPNPGSKATMWSLGGDVVAMVHNPNPAHRSPLALWVSFDGLKTWPYRRVLVPQSIDGAAGRLNYPEGFLSPDKQWLHFAYDDNRHNAVYYAAKLPPIPAAK